MTDEQPQHDFMMLNGKVFNAVGFENRGLALFVGDDGVLRSQEAPFDPERQEFTITITAYDFTGTLAVYDAGNKAHEMVFDGGKLVNIASTLGA